MSTMTFPDPMNGNPPNTAQNLATGRRAAALNLASSLWPSSSDLFAEEFLTDSFEDETIEIGRLLARVEALADSGLSTVDDLSQFRDALLEAAQSVFMRWKILHQLRTMALTDDLTGLYNRRGFLLLGMHYLSIASRNAQPLSLYFADVDGLKFINDARGHVQGDALLIACGEVLKMTFRESDIVARIGGDEFAVLVQGGTSESQEAVLNRLQSSIDGINRDVLSSCHLSLSVGVAKFDPHSPVTLGELLSIADRELMVQKRVRHGVDVLRPRAKAANGNGLFSGGGGHGHGNASR